MVINTDCKIKMGGVWDEKMCSSVLLKTSYTLTQSYMKEYSFALIILSAVWFFLFIDHLSKLQFYTH